MARIVTPTLSVIVATYNRPRSLLRLLDILDNQLRIDLSQVDVCVCDDGGDIDMTGLFRTYNFRLVYQYLRRANGPSICAAKNIAFDKSVGDVIIQLDDDLTFHERTLSEIQNYAALMEWAFRLRALPRAHWLWTARSSNNRDKAEDRQGFSRGPDGYWRDGKAVWETIDYRQCSAAGMVMPRRTWQDAGGYDEDFDGSMGEEDREFALRVQKLYGRLYLAPLFIHVEDEETGSYRMEMIAQAEQSNLDIFKRKHPNHRDYERNNW